MESVPRILQFVQIMSVNLDDMESERSEFVVERLGVHDLRGPAVNLKTIHINKYTEIIESIMRSTHGRLPYLSFRHLTVSAQRINIDIFIKKLCCLCHTDRRGESLTKGSC